MSKFKTILLASAIFASFGQSAQAQLVKTSPYAPTTPYGTAGVGGLSARMISISGANGTQTIISPRPGIYVNMPQFGGMGQVKTPNAQDLSKAEEARKAAMEKVKEEEAKTSAVLSKPKTKAENVETTSERKSPSDSEDSGTKVIKASIDSWNDTTLNEFQKEGDATLARKYKAFLLEGK